MIVNTKMARLMGDNREKSFREKLPPSLAWPKFVAKFGCVFLYGEQPDSQTELDCFEDEVSREAFVNHIHLSGKNFGVEANNADILQNVSRRT